MVFKAKLVVCLFFSVRRVSEAWLHSSSLVEVQELVDFSAKNA